MNKRDIQQRVLQNGKPLSLDKLTWDEETKTFASQENNLVLDFFGINDCTFKTGDNCTFKTGDNCTFKTGWDCTFKTGWDCTFTAGCDCTFSAGWDCTFDTGARCTFKTGDNCAIINHNVFEVITPESGQVIQICPQGTPGHLVDGMYKGVPHIIADGILSKIVHQKGDIYRVVNHGAKKESYLIKDGENCSHGSTIKDARDSLMYKISDRDTSAYDDLTLESELTKEEVIKMYRVITGACENGVKMFVESLESVKDNYTVQEIIGLTKGRYGNETLNDFITKEKQS